MKGYWVMVNMKTLIKVHEKFKIFIVRRIGITLYTLFSYMIIFSFLYSIAKFFQF